MTDSGVGNAAATIPGGEPDEELPQGWIRATLGELGEWYGGGTPSKRHPEFWTDGTIPWLSPKDMGEAVLSGTQDLIHESALDASPVKLIPEGSVALVVRSGILAHTVPVAYVPFEVTLNQDMKAVVPYEGVDAQWLAAAVKSRERHILADCRKHGTTVASLDVSRLRAVEIPVPPLPEQRRIVTKLEGQLAHIESGQSLTEQSIIDTDRLWESITEMELQSLDAPTVLLREVLARPLSNGKSVPTLEGGFPVLRLNSIRGEYVDLNVSKGGDWTGIDPEPYYVREGDFLVTRGNGTLGLVGRGALVPSGRDPVAYPDTLIRIRVDCDKMYPRFLRWIWDARLIRRQIEGQARTTAGIYKINQEILGGVEIPFPPLSGQEDFLKRVAVHSEAVEPLRTTVQGLLEHAVDLRAALLHAAFTGALVPQDPAEEHSPSFFARIRARREAAKAAARPPRQRSAPNNQTPDGQEELPL